MTARAGERLDGQLKMHPHQLMTGFAGERVCRFSEQETTTSKRIISLNRHNSAHPPVRNKVRKDKVILSAAATWMHGKDYS
jgi:hypothetical protein